MFVVVIINVPVIRENFVGVTEERFQVALASAVGLSPDYVYLDIIQAGYDPRSTTVTSKIATVDATEASALFQGLGSVQYRLHTHRWGLAPPL